MEQSLWATDDSPPMDLDYENSEINRILQNRCGICCYLLCFFKKRFHRLLKLKTYLETEKLFRLLFNHLYCIKLYLTAWKIINNELYCVKLHTKLPKFALLKFRWVLCMHDIIDTVRKIYTEQHLL